jgi:hypothetical protein
LPELEFQLAKLDFDRSGLRKYHYVKRIGAAASVDVSQAALETVAQYGLSECPPNGHNKAWWRTPGTDPEKTPLDPSPAFPVH